MSEGDDDEGSKRLREMGEEEKEKNRLVDERLREMIEEMKEKRRLTEEKLHEMEKKLREETEKFREEMEKKFREETEKIREESEKKIREEAEKRRQAEEEVRRLKEEQAKLPPKKASDAMRAYLAKIEFPASAAAYEFPDWEPSLDNDRDRAAVLEARVKKDWAMTTESRPNFLITGLEKPTVELQMFKWYGDHLVLRTDGFRSSIYENDFLKTGISFTFLVSASGMGKTRWLFEQAYKKFGVYLVADVGKDDVGSKDIADFLRALPEKAGANDAEVSNMSERLKDWMYRVLWARILVFERAREACKDKFEPRHWLALQLYPTAILGQDVFSEALKFSSNAVVDQMGISLAWLKSGLCFIALDEAQVVDQKFPETFPNYDRSARRSALAKLFDPIINLHSHAILSGTGLNIQSAYETMASSAAKDDVITFLVSPIALLKGESFRTALRACGVVREVGEETATLFAGRPRFAVRLAEGILLNKTTDEVAKEIIEEFRSIRFPELKEKTVTAKSGAKKNVYSEVRLAALRWMLHGDGSMLEGGDVALEAGVCALRALGNTSGSVTAFVIEEPLVVRAIGENPEAVFEGLANENDAIIGRMFEDYLAVHAASLCGIFSGTSFRKYLRLGSEAASFEGPWKLTEPRGDMRYGISCDQGDEPAKIAEILENAREGGRGPSFVFPGTTMGADLVVAASRPSDGRKLLIFVQAKSSPHTSTVLTLPYHINRDEKPEVPPNLQSAYESLNALIARPDVSVVFLVFKYPANSRGKHSMNVDYKGKKVLHLVVDRSNAGKLLPTMMPGLESLKPVKKARS